MNRLVTFSRALVGTLFMVMLTACSGGNEQPGEEDIKNAIAFNLPGGLEVDGVEILVTENAGSQVEPLIRNRANVTLEFADDFVSVVGRFDDKVVLKTLYTKGQELNDTVITSSRLKGDSWSVSIDRFDITRVNGTALGQFAEGSYAFEGTDEAAGFKQAFEDKLAREEAERQAAVAAAEKEKADGIAAFRAGIAGTWVAKASMMRNGGVYTGRDNKSTAGVEITFPEGDGASGIAPFTLYVIDNPNDKLTVDAGFTVAEDGKSVKVLGRSNTHKTLNMNLTDVWTLGSDGLLQTGRRDRWYVQLEKGGAALAQKNALAERLTNRDKAIEALVMKHQAGLAPNRFENMGIKRNTYTMMFVDATPDENQKVYGDGTYGRESGIALTAIHAGVLDRGEAGVVKITYRPTESRSNVFGTVKNGVTSGKYNDHYLYTIELVEKLEE